MLPFVAHRDPDAVVAWRGTQPITLRQLLADVHALAGRLPDAPWMLNGCGDRYRFVVGLGAALLRGQLSVLPHNHLPQTLERLAGEFPGLYCLTDGDAPVAPLARIAYPPQPAPPGAHAVPAFEAGRAAACLFTSGSTGSPVAHRRTWGTIVASGRAEAERLGIDATGGWAILGTVPSQHSYGFESSIHLALQSGAAVVADRPFYPADILDTLARLPAPRLLVTTPVHLRALLGEGRGRGCVEHVLSATAPLPATLAAEVETHFGAPVSEIYGSTESGQVASRRPTQDDAWTPLAGVRVGSDGIFGYAEAGHVGARTALADHLEIAPDGRFLLLGRSADMVNIAGKRSSIAFIERELLAIPGVRDAACLLTPDDDRLIPRIQAFVVAPGLRAREILAALRTRIEPAFLPRPLVRVEALPRDGTGKLPRERLLALAQSAGRPNAGGRDGQH
jgi:acyl-coenzyme A synthetase/AMP-(fatty) acid ligase